LRRWLLLLGWRASLEWLLLGRLLLLELVLLARIPRELRLHLLLRLLLRLLPKPLRLAGIASKLRLHWTSSKARWLRSQCALEAARLAVGLLLLLLAILGVPGSGAVPAP